MKKPDHVLKCINPFFQDIWDNNKTFEIRINDREYEIKDCVKLREYNPHNNSFSGRSITLIISYILYDEEYCKEDYCVFAFKIIDRKTK